MRDLVPAGPGGGAFRRLVPAATLRRWRDDLPGRGDLTVGVEGPDVVVRGDGLERREREDLAARYDGPDLYVALDPAYAADALRAQSPRAA